MERIVTGSGHLLRSRPSFPFAIPVAVPDR